MWLLNQTVEKMKTSSANLFHIVCPSPALQRLYELGGEVVESAQKCTHLVANKVLRTVKFLTAIPVVKHVVTSDWLEESWKSQKFVGEWRPAILPATASWGRTKGLRVKHGTLG